MAKAKIILSVDENLRNLVKERASIMSLTISSFCTNAIAEKVYSYEFAENSLKGLFNQIKIDPNSKN